jgi:hypothetical protein
MTDVAHLRLVHAPPPRFEVRIAVNERRQPFGRSRVFRLRAWQLERLLADAARLERAS